MDVPSGALWGMAVALAAAGLILAHQAKRWSPTNPVPAVEQPSAAAVVEGLHGLIGNTRLVLIRSLSEATGCKILGKAEFQNPGGSVKDRVALEIISEALSDGRLARGGLITEGSVGSTGVSLAMVAAAAGIRCFIAMPDDAAIEKSQMLEALGAEVRRVRPVSIAHPQHFVNVARRRAAAEDGAVFADQFENPANLRAHLATGAEILEQTGGQLDAFVAGAGTGGTIAGVSQVLKKHDPSIRVVLVDPPGSSLYNKVPHAIDTSDLSFLPYERRRTNARKHIALMLASESKGSLL